MKSLFDENGEFNDLTCDITNRIKRAFEPIVEECYQNDYDLRHLAYLTDSAVDVLCMQKLLKLKFDKNK